MVFGGAELLEDGPLKINDILCTRISQFGLGLEFRHILRTSTCLYIYTYILCVCVYI